MREYSTGTILTDEHIGGCERGDEVIARLPDGPVDDERQQHKDVAAHGEYDAEGQRHRYQHRLPERERRQDWGQHVLCGCMDSFNIT